MSNVLHPSKERRGTRLSPQEVARLLTLLLLLKPRDASNLYIGDYFIHLSPPPCICTRSAAPTTRRTSIRRVRSNRLSGP